MNIENIAITCIENILRKYASDYPRNIFGINENNIGQLLNNFDVSNIVIEINDMLLRNPEFNKEVLAKEIAEKSYRCVFNKLKRNDNSREYDISIEELGYSYDKNFIASSISKELINNYEEVKPNPKLGEFITDTVVNESKVNEKLKEFDEPIKENANIYDIIVNPQNGNLIYTINQQPVSIVQYFGEKYGNGSINITEKDGKFFVNGDALNNPEELEVISQIKNIQEQEKVKNDMFTISNTPKEEFTLNNDFDIAVEQKVSQFR